MSPQKTWFFRPRKTRFLTLSKSTSISRAQKSTRFLSPQNDPHFKTIIKQQKTAPIETRKFAEMAKFSTFNNVKL